MIPILKRTVPNFSEDQYTEINERISETEDHSRKISLLISILVARIDRLERKNQFLLNWVHKLNDAHDFVDEAVDILELLFSEQQQAIEELSEQMQKLSINN